MEKAGWRDRLRYRFDNFFARGTFALIFGLFAVSAAIVLFIAILVKISGAIADRPDLDFLQLLWFGLLRTLDPGTMGGDEGTPGFLAAMLVVTFGGIFVVSALIGVLTAGIEGKLGQLRRGRSRVIESGHIVILGWTQQVFTIVAELIVANANQPRSTIVILAERDKVEMEEEIRARVGRTGRTRVVCRTGSPMDLDDLAIANIVASKAVIILSPPGDDPDAEVIKSMLAITNHPSRRPEPYHIVAELHDPVNLDVARMVGRDEVELILGGDLIARITAQTCRQSGLSVVYSELLDFDGDEIYFADVPAVTGMRFGEALGVFETSSVIGLVPAGGAPLLNPPMDTEIRAGDRLIAISADDDTVQPRVGAAPPVALEAIREAVPREARPERTLILGWNWRAPRIIRELDAYVPTGSSVLVVTDTTDADAVIAGGDRPFERITVRIQRREITERRTLDALHLEEFDHVIVLCPDGLDGQRADARTLITLLHLRDIAAVLNRDFSIVTEMLDLRNRALAEVARADDFIVSERLISLLMSQVAENKALNAVFADIFDPEGSEIYLRPAADYVALERPVTFATVVESARRRNEIAIGYRAAARSQAAGEAYGVVVNAPKSREVTFGAADRVIVVAEG